MNSSITSQIAPYTQDFQNLPKQDFAAGLKDKTHSLTEYQGQLVKSAQNCWEQWQNTARGKRQMEKMAKMPVSEVKTALENLAKSRTFAPTMKLMANPPVNVDFPINAFSIGLNFEIEIVIGFTGTVGVAVNPTDPSLDSSVFLSLGIDEGAAVGAIGGVQFGFWTVAPNELGGWSYGVEVLIDDEIFGATVGAYWMSNGDFQGIAVTPGVGLEDGIEIQESYTFILGNGSLGFPPIYQRDADHFLILTKIKCNNIAGGDGSHNEIYFKFKPDGGTKFPYPSWDYFAMAEGDTWHCGRSVKFNGNIKVTLYDADDGGDDNLGDITINFGDSGLTVGVEKKYNIYSKHGFDERNFDIYAKLLY